MRANLQQLFKVVPQGAVGGFNILNLEMALAVLEAAELTRRPVAIGISADEFDAVNAPLLTHSLVAAIHTSSAPVALHLDRVRPDNVGLIQQALDMGFTSVMLDGSGLTLGRCSELTAEVVDVARRYVASVEVKPPADPFDAPTLARFVRNTGVDALVLLDGVNGVSLERLAHFASLQERRPTALVIHGASRLSAPFIDRAIGVGVRKVTCFLGLMDNTLKNLRLHTGRPRLTECSSTDELLRLKEDLHGNWVEAVAAQLQRYANPLNTELGYEPSARVVSPGLIGTRRAVAPTD